MLFSSPAWDAVVYWALDLETGGLDPRADPILAVGLVPVREGTIRLGEAFRSLVRPQPGKVVLPRSVEAHQLVEDELRDAPTLGDVLSELEHRVGDGVLLVHHKAFDVAFLKQAYREARRRWPGPPVVDTVDLLLRIARRAHRASPELPADAPSVNLAQARRRHGLPDYQVHDALTDAIAAAELFLVLRDALGARTLRDLR